MGAVSLSPGRLSLSTSPNAISAPNAIAVFGSFSPSAAVCATAATSHTPAATTSSSWPESRTCQGYRSSSSWAVGRPFRWLMAYSAAVDAERSAGVVVVLRGGGGQVVGREHRRLGTLPAFALERGHERVHEGRVELGARPLPQLLDGLLDRAGAAVGAGRRHRVEGVGHRQH